MTEAEILFTEILKCDRLSLCLNKNAILDKDKSIFISRALKRRMTGESLQYILGKTEFMGLEFKVDPYVLIPRPETEILVETVIKLVHSRQSLPAAGTVNSILDIGTGSGCIAVSLAKLLSNVNITAVDISEQALAVAKENARLNGVEVDFVQSDLFNTYHLTPNTYHLIVSNPPYVATAEITELQPEVKSEPRIALDGGKDGCDFYRRIIQESPPYLKEDGFLVVEIGYGQKVAVENIFQKSGNFEIIEIIKDYNNIDRIIVARKTHS